MDTEKQTWDTPTLTTLNVSLDTAASKLGSASDGTFPTAKTVK
jgi:hypothetical protein